MDTLTMLDIERKFWRTAGAKEDVIREHGLTPTRYYQLLNQLLDDQAVMAADPVTVKRLLRLRTGRRR